MTLDKEEIDKLSSTDDMPNETIRLRGGAKKRDSGSSKKSKKGSMKCRQCDKTFASKDSLNQHITAAHPKSWECRQCGKSCSTKESLKQHLEATGHNKRSSSSSKKESKPKETRKSGRKPDVICRQCEKRFYGQSDLEKHIIAAHPRVECTECHKTFINDQALAIHKRHQHELPEKRKSGLNPGAYEFKPGQPVGGSWSTRSSLTMSPFYTGRRPSKPGGLTHRASRTGIPFSGHAPTQPTKDAPMVSPKPKFTEENAPEFPGTPEFARSPRRSTRKSRRMTLPQPDPRDLEGDAPPISYEIGAGWVVYWNPPTSLEHSVNNQEYVHCLREIADFQGVANFWGKIKQVQKPSKIQHGAHNLMVFRKGLVPAWESFPAGGSWIINYHRWEEDCAQIDALWDTVMFGLASEAFGTPEVVGASLHIRSRGYRICIWNRDNRVGDVRFQIADKLRMLLSLHPRKEIKYKYFSCCLKDGSTTSQATPYQFVKVTF